MRLRLRSAVALTFLAPAVLASGGGLAAPPAPPAPAPRGAEPPMSAATRECVNCHQTVTPGIVADWRRSLHARATVREALARPVLSRQVSAASVPEALARVVVGCAECHTLAPGKHPDAFEHGGEKVHTIVSPPDCATCHPVEVTEFDQNLMSRAHTNLEGNALYQDLVRNVAGLPARDGKTALPPDAETRADACLACHGTRVTVGAKVDRGGMEIPVLHGWPNQGVGRINPDGSRGACTACHTRHQFSIETARKPSTCATCHSGPDVPAYKVWSASKHGVLYASHGASWSFSSVPWTVGKDYTAPTCAGCHISLVVDEEGSVVSKRTHRMNDRIPYRLFGLPHAHPHPRSPDTTTIRNRAGLPLPTELTGEPATVHLIDAAEQKKRLEAMKAVCTPCHASGWTDGHFARLEHTISTTNAHTLAATKVLLEAWKRGFAQGPDRKGSPFDEPIERLWVSQWLFYANSTRLAAAMGNADRGVFDGGRFQLSDNLARMREWLAGRLGRRN